MVEEAVGEAPRNIARQKFIQPDFQNQWVWCGATADCQNGFSRPLDYLFLVTTFPIHSLNNENQRHGRAPGNTSPAVDKQRSASRPFSEVQDLLQMADGGSVNQLAFLHVFPSLPITS